MAWKERKAGRRQDRTLSPASYSLPHILPAYSSFFSPLAHSSPRFTWLQFKSRKNGSALVGQRNFSETIVHYRMRLFRLRNEQRVRRRAAAWARIANRSGRWCGLQWLPIPYSHRQNMNQTFIRQFPPYRTTSDRLEPINWLSKSYLIIFKCQSFPLRDNQPLLLRSSICRSIHISKTRIKH